MPLTCPLEALPPPWLYRMSWATATPELPFWLAKWSFFFLQRNELCILRSGSVMVDEELSTEISWPIGHFLTSQHKNVVLCKQFAEEWKETFCFAGVL